MSNTSISVDIYSAPPFDTFGYSTIAQIYYIISGLLTIAGNSYLIVLFILYKKLRQLQCNWLIAYLSAVEVLIGIGTLVRGTLIRVAIENSIVKFNFIFCSIAIPIIFSVSYRLEQSIALMIAIDRLIAIWKPVWYNKNQDYKVCFIALCISVLVFALLTFVVFFDVYENNIFNLNDISTVTLDKCVIPISFYWYHILPSYSGIISIVFFVVYLISLSLFWRTLNNTKKKQIHATNSISKMQSRVFITVSLALFSMTIFYVAPTVLQMLGYYFGFNDSGWVASVALIFIQFGAEFNGILNALIYLMKHQEFRESSKKFLALITKKTSPFDNHAWGSNNVIAT